jgi:tetratricopeptide (TPR) repeat protein
MECRKIASLVLMLLFAAQSAFPQSEALKTVVNNLAFYKEKKDLKYLSGAKKTVDSLIKASPDTVDLERNVYRAVVYSSILYIDSLNKLNLPASTLALTSLVVDRLQQNGKIYKFDTDIDYCKTCLANVYIRKAFIYANSLDYNNALQLFEKAHQYAPAFNQLNAYIAWCNNKLGNLGAAAKYYTSLIGDSTKAEYVEAASAIYKTYGDTVMALQVVKKGRKLLPNDRSLLLDEASIYNTRKDYRSMAALLPQLLDLYPNNADIAFIAANCCDHLNQYDKAESLYLRAIELNTSAYEPVFNLGLLYFKQSKMKQERGGGQDTALAQQWLEKASEISPNDANCLKVLQLVYAYTGNINQQNRINNKLKQLTNQ